MRYRKLSEVACLDVIAEFVNKVKQFLLIIGPWLVNNSSVELSDYWSNFANDLNKIREGSLRILNLCYPDIFGEVVY